MKKVGHTSKFLFDVNCKLEKQLLKKTVEVGQ